MSRTNLNQSQHKIDSYFKTSTKSLNELENRKDEKGYSNSFQSKRNSRQPSLDKSFNSKIGHSQSQAKVFQVDSSEEQEDPVDLAQLNQTNVDKYDNMIDNVEMKCDSKFKDQLKHIHLTMHNEIKTLKLANEEKEKDNRILKREVDEINTNQVYSKSMIDQRDKDFKELKEELDRLKTNNAAEYKMNQEYDKSLLEFKGLQQQADQARNHLEDEVKTLKQGMTVLKVDNLNLAQEVADLKQTNEILVKLNGVQNQTLSSKIVSQDEKVKALQDDSKLIKDQSSSVVSLFKDMDQAQAQYLDRFAGTAHKVERVDTTASALKEQLDRIESGPFKNIDQNLSRLNNTVTANLDQELKAVHDKRVQIDRESTKLASTFEETCAALNANVKTIAAKVNELEGIRTENYMQQLPKLIASFFFAVFVTLVFDWLFVQSRR